MPLRPPRFFKANLKMTSPWDPNGYLDGLKYYKELDNVIDETTQSAIDEAALLIPLNFDDLKFAPRLKTLVILLLRRFRRTAAMNDLQHAILRAEEMMVATSPCHPERGARVEDWVDMMLVKGYREGFQEEDLGYVVEMARQVGKTVEFNRTSRDYGYATYASERPNASLAVLISNCFLI